MPAGMKRYLTVASYNVHSCIGIDNYNSPCCIAEVIKEIEPDIIALQEVDAGYQDDCTREQLNELKALSGMEAHEGPTMRRDDCYYGNVIMTRWPVTSVKRHDISVKGFEPRGVIDVGMVIHGIRMRFISTHLGLRSSERRVQADRLINIISRDDFTFTAIAGDFNEWLPLGYTARRLRELGGRSIAALSFPSRFPIFPLDRLWFFTSGSVKEKVVDSGIHYSRLSRIASDHLPIYAKIDLERLGAG